MKLRVDDITWREIDGDLVILDLRSSTYLTANASGTVLMRQLTEERTLQQLIQALIDAFGIAERRAQQDVQTFLDELGERGLLEYTAASATQTPSPLPAAGESRNAKEVSQCKTHYEPPKLTTVGSVRSLTMGQGFRGNDDTSRLHRIWVRIRHPDLRPRLVSARRGPGGTSGVPASPRSSSEPDCSLTPSSGRARWRSRPAGCTDPSRRRRVPHPSGTPRDALDDAIRSALVHGPCYVTLLRRSRLVGRAGRGDGARPPRGP